MPGRQEQVESSVSVFVIERSVKKIELIIGMKMECLSFDSAQDDSGVRHLWNRASLNIAFYEINYTSD